MLPSKVIFSAATITTESGFGFRAALISDNCSGILGSRLTPSSIMEICDHFSQQEGTLINNAHRVFEMAEIHTPLSLLRLPKINSRRPRKTLKQRGLFC
ncbi:hypothetical protein AVEN_58327-1 [Araneus ventricosus]|uniref:Uncharacterized protein n=1 Tax=Araneus ventricosus TaxID=182803 RepID=A0A4Y2CRR5_ARAVE|nr:hypothetical protein AVEN_58327-1 [Araneus ventricosus]